MLAGSTRGGGFGGKPPDTPQFGQI